MSTIIIYTICNDKKRYDVYINGCTYCGISNCDSKLSEIKAAASVATHNKKQNKNKKTTTTKKAINYLIISQSPFRLLIRSKKCPDIFIKNKKDLLAEMENSINDNVFISV